MWPRLETRLRVLEQELRRKFEVGETAMRSGLTLPTLEGLKQAKQREEQPENEPPALTPSMIYNAFMDQEAENAIWDCCNKWKRSTPSAPTPVKD
jgi:hypothetical protein